MTTRTPILVAEGDSWFSHPKHSRDILDRFTPGNWQDFKYEVKHAASHSDKLEDMVCKDYQRNEVKELLRILAKKSQIPKAILLSAGGNDIVNKLNKIINHKKKTRGILNYVFIRAFIDGLLNCLFNDLVEYITEECDSQFGKKIPILVHGYACSVPDGRGHAFRKKGWMQPVFKKKGYSALGENTAAVSEVMEVFNKMVSRLPNSYSHVRYVDLRPLVISASDEDYWSDWEDELHLTITGLRKVATAFDNEIKQIGT